MGNGVIVDSSGLVVTIGYLIRGAYAIEVTLADGKQVPGSFVGYDHESGFGLLRAHIPAGMTPIRIGDSDAAVAGNPSLVLSADGPLPIQPVAVVSRRPFAGYWEYLLENAIFTAPPQPRFGGAALVNREGRLIGIGSLLVSDAAGPQVNSPGNMFVPINLLKPLMAELLELGRPASKGPAWLGITTLEVDGRVIVRRVRNDGPAASAGVQPSDIILGVGEEPIGDTIDFLRKVRALGGPGAMIPLVLVRKEGESAALLRILVTAASRYDWMESARGQ
jgi:S1-C subfamily serine protease